MFSDRRSPSEKLLASLDADLHRRLTEAEALDTQHPGTLARFTQAVQEERQRGFEETQRTGRGLPPLPLGPEPSTLISRD